MGIEMRILMMVGLVLCLTTVVHAAQGNAVYYKPPYTRVSKELWNDKKACGRKYRVRCIGGANEAPHPCHKGESVVVTVVDFCQPPCNGILNLSQDAFDVIADRDAGKVRVEYTQV
ncbi:hypothetical protein EZV62_012293 [Acer yangbiense]|uniref:Expansin-like EG45 domain-containing protein n=1 Tax=Acer yangbiense TaxID=1000413 RepID=A0A5C7HVG8_9ROSI|nr:hypothetical protein EZV62_012293 [Acer yangbiense]